MPPLYVCTSLEKADFPNAHVVYGGSQFHGVNGEKMGHFMVKIFSFDGRIFRLEANLIRNREI